MRRIPITKIRRISASRFANSANSPPTPSVTFGYCGWSCDANRASTSSFMVARFASLKTSAVMVTSRFPSRRRMDARASDSSMRATEEKGISRPSVVGIRSCVISPTAACDVPAYRTITLNSSLFTNTVEAVIPSKLVRIKLPIACVESPSAAARSSSTTTRSSGVPGLRLSSMLNTSG